MKIYAIWLLLAFCCPVCKLYGDFQCPSSSERRLRAKWFCQKYGLKEEDYACLFDTIGKAYQEKCSYQANILDPGQKYILNNRPNSFECENADRYQPFGLQHFSDQCVYLRSKCSEPGQVRYNEGSKTVDKSCRCNFAQGYAFVKAPKMPCFCTPSIEDCSCYLKRCPDSFIISSDYQCIHMNNKSFQPSCPGMNNQEKPREDTTLHKRDFHDHSFEDPTFHSGYIVICIAVFILIIGVISCYLGQNKMPSVCLKQISPPTKLKTFPETGSLTLTWASPVQDDFKIEFYKILYTSNEWKDTENISVKATQLSCTIPNVLPMKTYRFTISSCLKNVEGKPSIEHLFKSGGPLPPTELTTMKDNGSLILTWTSPLQDLFEVDFYEISYTSDEWNHIDHISVDAKKSSHKIPNILPMMTYRFKIASCLINFKGKPSLEHRFQSGAPIPPTELATFQDDGDLKLTWTSPIQDLFHVVCYKLVYTSNEWCDTEHIQVDVMKSSCIIPNVLPLKTYRFKIASCLTNFDGESSAEHKFQSGRPNCPPTLQYYIEKGNKRNIRLVWTSPVETLFKTESYDLEITQDEWKNMNTFSLPASALQYVINDFTVDATYRVKIYSVSHLVKSLPTQNTCIASPRYLVKIQLNGPVHEDALHNKSSDIFNVLQKGIVDAAKTAFTDCPGNQVVADIEFSRGSFYAVFILISQGCHNVEKLRNILEETIKTGKFGRFLVSMEGFIFKALDDPIPPQFDHIEIVDTVINISWAKEKETFFKTKHYLLQFTTDDWETCEEILKPADQNQYSILDTLPSTKYKFKIVTIAQGDIKSLPSKEIYIITRDFNTDIVISEHKEVGQSIKENINTRGDPENSEVLVKYEKEEQENIKTRGDSEKSEVHVKYEKEEQEHIRHVRAAQVVQTVMSEKFSGVTTGLGLEDKVPTEIKLMTDKRSVELYLKLLESGSEKKRDIRLVVVGKQGTGKTSLIKRLFGEDITDVTSTNGIAVHKIKCKAKSDDGIWSKLDGNYEETEAHARLLKEYEGKLQNKGTIEEPVQSHIAIKDNTPATSFNASKKSGTVYQQSKLMTSRVTTESQDEPPVALKQRNQSLEQAKMDIETMLKSNIDLHDKEEYATLSLWDFAGDEEFYHTHQTFLSPDAIYLVVTKLTEADDKKAKDLFQLWMDSIHCYSRLEEDRNKSDVNEKTSDDLDPPIVIVGTWKDALVCAVEKIDDACRENIFKYTENMSKDELGHIRQDYYISNTEDDPSVFRQIRENILNLARKMKTWNKDYPLKFIQLEKRLHEQKKELPIISLPEIQKIAVDTPQPLNVEELRVFLEFHHEIRALVYFKDIPSFIVLDTQWLSDAFSCIVTAKKFRAISIRNKNKWNELYSRGKLHSEVLDEIFRKGESIFSKHKDHILNVMEKFDIIIRPNTSETQRDADDNKPLYYIPCMIASEPECNIYQMFNVTEKTCTKSTWLCYQFRFLPPHLMNHLIASLCRKYNVAEIVTKEQKRQIALFRGSAVFELQKATKLRKLLIMKGPNVIQIQVWHFGKQVERGLFKYIADFVTEEIIKLISKRFKMSNVRFELKWECGQTKPECVTGSFDLSEDQEKIYYCETCSTIHTFTGEWSDLQQKTSDEHMRAAQVAQFTKEEINFTKMGMIVFHIFADVLYDLLKPDKPHLPPRCDCDITYLYREHRKLHKHIPSNNWGGTWQTIKNTDITIGDDIERIRLTRNELHHSPILKLDNIRFNELCHTFSDLLNRFDNLNKPTRLYTDGLNKILAKTISAKDVKSIENSLYGLMI